MIDDSKRESLPPFKPSKGFTSTNTRVIDHDEHVKRVNDQTYKEMLLELERWERIAPVVRGIFEELDEKYAPYTFLFYRKNKPKLRKTRSTKTNDQNNNSFCAVPMESLNGFGGVVRNLKHKGFGELVAILDPAPNERQILARKPWRMIRFTYKNISEVAQRYQLTEEEVKFLNDQYPSKATGQLKMFF